MLQQAVAAMTVDPRSIVLGDLSACDITLLVAFGIVEVNLELTSYTFETAYNAYLKQLKAHSNSGTKPVLLTTYGACVCDCQCDYAGLALPLLLLCQMSKSTLLKSFEKLIQLDLVTPIRDIASLFDKPDETGGLKHRVRVFAFVLLLFWVLQWS